MSTHGGSGKTLVVGVDVGGTNTDSVLLDISKSSGDAVLASHKTPTSANVTLSVQASLETLLSKSTVKASDITALAIGTTHFLNAIIEKDTSRVEKVAVLRLASHGFSAGAPPFADWPRGLEKIIHGHSAIIPGGCNIDGTLIGPIDEASVKEQAAIIKSKGIKNIVVVGIGSVTDEKYHQEDTVHKWLRTELGDDVNIVLSHNIARPGLLARENASILNASIMNFARRTIRAFIGAIRRIDLQCPLYLTSNVGHLLPASEAMRTPIRVFSSGATNSIRGAAFLAKSSISQAGSIVVDIGGTTTDVGYLLKNGYPRLAKSYTNLAGVKVNLEMPSVESIGLGGGSVLHVADDGNVIVGPDSVGHDLTTKALCFGGDIATATDVAVTSGVAGVGTSQISLTEETAAKANARMKKMLEDCIDRVKLSPEPCTVILVGGGSILCPKELAGVDKVVVPEHAGVANAIGAAIAKVFGAAEIIVRGDGIQEGIAQVKARAIQNAVAHGGHADTAIILYEEASGIPYTTDQTLVKVEVACEADHKRVHEEIVSTSVSDALIDQVLYEETKKHEIPVSREDEEAKVKLSDYKPVVTPAGEWILSETDIRFLGIGCYILGCGGGGSPYAPYLHMRQLLLEGDTIRITRIEDLKDEDIMPPVASVGTPAVSIERPGGNGVLYAMQAMEKEIGVKFDHLVATEIGGANGVGTLIWGSTRFYNMPIVDGDLMGRAYPNFEMKSQYLHVSSVDELLPVILCSGSGETAIIPAPQPDVATASLKIRTACVGMGSAAGAAGRPFDGKSMRQFGIPNTYSLAWRLGRAVAVAQQTGNIVDVPKALIAVAGGEKSAQVLFQGKIRSVKSTLTTTAHSLGEVTIERLSDSEMETEVDKVGEGWVEIVVPFMNENLVAIGKREDGSEQVLATIPDLIFLLDTSTGEAVGVQEYRYGLKVTVMIMAPHPIWATERALEVAGPSAFHLPYSYKTNLEYTRPVSVIDEFRPQV